MNEVDEWDKWIKQMNDIETDEWCWDKWMMLKQMNDVETNEQCWDKWMMLKQMNDIETNKFQSTLIEHFEQKMYISFKCRLYEAILFTKKRFCCKMQQNLFSIDNIK